MTIETKIDIEEEIKKKTTECNHDFSCLKGSNDCLCEIESQISNKLLFIKPHANSVCNYKLSFGYKFICNCPTRNHLYKVNKI